MRVLFVGFKGKNNTSFRLVSLLNGERLFLTNSFAGAARDIDALHMEYDAAIMFGLDKDLSGTVRIEERAALQGNILSTACNISRMIDAFVLNGISCEVSGSPTPYLCNDAYFRMLQKTNGNAVLIHIPGIRNMTDELMEGIVKSLGGSPCPFFQNKSTSGSQLISGS